MAQVLRSREARCGIEVLRTEDSVVMAILDTDCAVTLKSHPTVWAEVGEQYQGGKHIFNFDDEWRPLFRMGPAGVEPYPVVEATRKFIRGCYSEPAGFKGGALDALIDVLPHGEVHLFVRGVGFIGRFCSIEDAQMIAGALKAERPILFSSAEEFMALPDPDQVEVITLLDPGYQWPKKFTLQHAQGVIDMAKKATKKKATKVAKAEAAQRRADGPVSKAREIFEKMYAANKEVTSSEIIKACEDAGVNRGTATTQLGRWRKEKNITVKRGGARKKGDEKSAAKKKDKPSPGKKKANPPQPALPKSKTKGEKRHKPKPQSSATPDKSSDTPPAAAQPPSGASSPKTQGSPTPSSPAKPASASTAAAPGATPASTSPAASSPSTASSEPTTS